MRSRQDSAAMPSIYNQAIRGFQTLTRMLGILLDIIQIFHYFKAYSGCSESQQDVSKATHTIGRAIQSRKPSFPNK